jgi:hypothetical protein
MLLYHILPESLDQAFLPDSLYNNLTMEANKWFRSLTAKTIRDRRIQLFSSKAKIAR